MRYQSIAEWRDLTDNHLYQPGNAFPFDGRAIPAERIDALVSGNNGAGIALIRAVKDQAEENPTEQAEQPKKGGRGRKKATQEEHEKVAAENPEE